MKNKTLWISIAVFALLAVIFAFTDWQISQALYNPESGWAHFLEGYGQLPGSLLGFISGSILLRTYRTEKNAKSILGIIGLSLLTALAGLSFFGDAFGAQTGADLNIALILGSAIVTLILMQVLLRRFPLETVARYKNAAKVGLALMFLAGFVTVWAIKIPWGRWTYRDILEAGNPALFTPWYLPQGSNGHHSFISGHTSLSFVVIGYIPFLKKGSSARHIVLAVLLLWGLTGAISRIVMGAHFASDTLFGAGQTLLWFWFLKNKFVK